MAHQTHIIKIDGMTCGGCVASIYNTTADIDGLDEIGIELIDKQARVTFDDTKTTLAAIVSAIDDAGFEATVIRA